MIERSAWLAKRGLYVASALLVSLGLLDGGPAGRDLSDFGIGARPVMADDDAGEDEGGDVENGGAIEDFVGEEEALEADADILDEFENGEDDGNAEEEDLDLGEEGEGEGEDEDEGENGEGGEDDDDDVSGPSTPTDGNSTRENDGDAGLVGPPRIEILTTETADQDALVEEREILAFAPDAASLDQIESLGYSVVGRETLSALQLAVAQIDLGDDRSIDDALAELRATVSDVAFEANHVYRLSGQSCDDADCYGAEMIGWAGDRAACGADITIGLIDSGVDLSEPALKSSNVTQRTFVRDRTAAPTDHGTAMAALLVAGAETGFSGLLPASELLVAAAFYQHADGSIRANALALARSLDWLVGARADVINFSLTGPPNGLVEQSIARARAAGALIVAAAGNNGPTGPPLYPGAYDDVLAITAVDRFLRVYRRANRGGYIFAAAPGVGIWTPTGAADGRTWQGTSFASVFASALLAERLSRDGNPSTVADAVARDARDLGAPGRDPVFGWGLVSGRPGCLAAP